MTTPFQNSLERFTKKIQNNTKRLENIIKEIDELKLGPGRVSEYKR